MPLPTWKEIFILIISKIWFDLKGVWQAIFTLWFTRKGTPRHDWVDVTLDIESKDDVIYVSDAFSFYYSWKVIFFLLPIAFSALVEEFWLIFLDLAWITSFFFLAAGVRWLAGRAFLDPTFSDEQYHRAVTPEHNFYEVLYDLVFGLILLIIGRTIVSLWIFKTNCCANDFLGGTAFYEPALGLWLEQNFAPEVVKWVMDLFEEPSYFYGLREIDSIMHYRRVTAIVCGILACRIALREFCTVVMFLTIRMYRDKRLARFDRHYWRRDPVTYEQIMGTLRLVFRKYKMRIILWLNLTLWWVHAWILYALWCYFMQAWTAFMA